MAESAKDNPTTAKPLKPARDTQRLMSPVARDPALIGLSYYCRNSNAF